MSGDLYEQQAAAWDKVLERHGLVGLEVDDARALAEQIVSALGTVHDNDIESDYGFGDYDRGVATLAAILAIKARRPASYIQVQGAGPNGAEPPSGGTGTVVNV